MGFLYFKLKLKYSKMAAVLTGGAAAICCVCNSGHDEASMLLCGDGVMGCDRGFHIGCLSPPLHSIPESDWFCSRCGEGSSSDEDDDDDDGKDPNNDAISRWIRDCESDARLNGWSFVAHTTPGGAVTKTLTNPSGVKFRSMKSAYASLGVGGSLPRGRRRPGQPPAAAARVVPEGPTALEKARDAVHRDAKRFLARAMRLDKFAHFSCPVPLEDFPDYLDLCPTPQDLGSIAARLEARDAVAEGGYTRKDASLDLEQLGRHLDAVCANSLAYNPAPEEGAGVAGDPYVEAQKLRTIFAAEVERMVAKAIESRLHALISDLRAVNTEPAMQGTWRKTPFSRRPYVHLPAYRPAPGLPPAEVDAVHQILVAAKPDGCLPSPLFAWETTASASASAAAAAPSAAAHSAHPAPLPWYRQPPKRLGVEVEERDVWGIDCFTRRNIEVVLECVEPASLRLSADDRSNFIEKVLLPMVNALPPSQSYDLRHVAAAIEARAADLATGSFTAPRLVAAVQTIRSAVLTWPEANFLIHPKGCGIIARAPIVRGEFIEQYLGDMYAPSSWAQLEREEDARIRKEAIESAAAERAARAEEKAAAALAAANAAALAAAGSDGSAAAPSKKRRRRCGACDGCTATPQGACSVAGIAAPRKRSVVQRASRETALQQQRERREQEHRQLLEIQQSHAGLPDFYNIALERHVDDGKGFGIVYIDAKNAGSFTSRMSHSCNPNCASQVVIVDGKYTIMLRALKNISIGEELTQNYGASTDSEWEYRAAICLCGTSKCHGSFLHFNRHAAFLQVANAEHTPLHRAVLLAHAATAPAAMPLDVERFNKFHFGECILSPLPSWLRKWGALLLGFIDLEQRLLPEVLEKKGGLSSADAKISALGMVDKRVMAVVMNLDAARARAATANVTAASAPPPLRLLEGAEVAAYLWSGPHSIARRAIDCIRSSCTVLQPKWYVLTTRYSPGATPEKYYVNTLTEETVWHRPADFGVLVPVPPKGLFEIEVLLNATPGKTAESARRALIKLQRALRELRCPIKEKKRASKTRTNKSASSSSSSSSSTLLSSSSSSSSLSTTTTTSTLDAAESAVPALESKRETMSVAIAPIVPAVASSNGVRELGCSRCRYSRRGCTRCVNPNFGGRAARAGEGATAVRQRRRVERRNFEKEFCIAAVADLLVLYANTMNFFAQLVIAKPSASAAASAAPRGASETLEASGKVGEMVVIEEHVVATEDGERDPRSSLMTLLGWIEGVRFSFFPTPLF